jgi:Flp pilus assembly pilin Flp
MFRMMAKLFQKEELGQGLAEYCLLTALLMLIGLGVFVHLSGGVQAIWGNANTALSSTSTGGSQNTPNQPGGN